MNSNNSQRKIQILQSENKKPPKKIQNKVEEQEITSEQEKIYLDGEPHIDPTSIDEEIMCPPIEEKEKIPKKELKIYRPREKYLKEKLSKLNYDEKLLTNIQKGLGDQVENIKSQIQDKNILITEVPKDLNKYIIRSASTENKIIKYSNQDYELKKKHKITKELKEEQAQLRSKLKKIEENESLLNNEGFMNLNNTYDGLTQFDKSIKEQHIKTITNKKNEIKERLIEIESRLKLIIEDDNNKQTRKEKLQTFKENFERDKEIIEARAKKYLKETKERNQRLANDINQLVEKRKKEIEQKEKDDELKKDKIRKKFIEKEKAIEQKRLKENKEIMLKYKPYVNERFEKSESNYIYGIYEKKYLEKEQKLIKKVNMERKLKNKTVTSEELQSFRNKVDEKKEELKKLKEIRDKDELEKFELAKNYQPSYVSHFNDMVEEEINKLKEKEKNRKEEILGLKELKVHYADKIREKKRPGIDEKLKKERMDKIVALENPKLVQIKDTLVKRKKKKYVLKKRDKSKPSKLDDEKIKELNNSAIIESNLIKRPKRIIFSSSFSIKKKREEEEEEKEKGKDNDDKKKKKKTQDEQKPGKRINYLTELRMKRLKTSGDADTEIKKIRNPKEWEKELERKDGNILQNIYSVKQQAENLGKKAEMEEQLLKLNGGIENNPELGKKVTGYLIGSIEAKLSILNQMYKNDEKKDENKDTNITDNKKENKKTNKNVNKKENKKDNIKENKNIKNKKENKNEKEKEHDNINEKEIENEKVNENEDVNENEYQNDFENFNENEYQNDFENEKENNGNEFEKEKENENENKFENGNENEFENENVNANENEFENVI